MTKKYELYRNGELYDSFAAEDMLVHNYGVAVDVWPEHTWEYRITKQYPWVLRSIDYTPPRGIRFGVTEQEMKNILINAGLSYPHPSYDIEKDGYYCEERVCHVGVKVCKLPKIEINKR